MKSFRKSFKAFTIVEIAIVTIIAGVVVFVISNSLTKTKNNAQTQRTAYDTETSKFSGVMSTADNSIAFPSDAVVSIGIKRSCKEILDAGGSTGSGEYTIDPDGSGTAAGSFKVYCDMDASHGGGGWTLIAAQFEDSPITNWNQGINEATFTAPTATIIDTCGNSTTGSCNSATNPSAAGFVLSSSQLPTGRTEVAFGRGTNSTYIGYATYNFSSSGNINPPVLVTNTKNGNQYYIHRRSDGFYNCHNPNLGFVGPSSIWNNTLTFHVNNNTCDQGATWDAWAFCPFQGSLVARGYYMGQANGLVWGTNDAFAWTVWVR